MSSNASSIDGPSALTYRRTFYIITAFAGALALTQLRRYFFPPPSASQTLHRRNAVRHHRHPQRRGGISLPSGETYESSSPVAPSLALAQREQEGRGYGRFSIQVDSDRSLECSLLPSQLASVERIQREVGANLESANLMRHLIEDEFLTRFLMTEFPPSHVILLSTGEWRYLLNELTSRGISETAVNDAFTRFNENPNFGEELNREGAEDQGANMVVNSNAISTEQRPPQPDLGDTTIDDQSLFSWRDGTNDTAPPREGQNLLNLLYHIAEDQARRDGYIHRGVTCNSCGVMPIQGIRYRCANCVDYDLCEACEASQVHILTHLFYKVRIPTPSLGSAKQVQPVLYPGKPNLLPHTLPRNVAKRLKKETDFENTEVDALWDQFRCLANAEWLNDPNNLLLAIDRKTFDRCFIPNRPPPPSLIYDRMFSFYDTNGDGLIGFEEFLKGLASFGNKGMHERLKRIFAAYDIDGDGYVERKDFLRIFRAYYTLSRDLTRDMMAGMEDDFMESGSRDVVLGSQPVSAAFPGTIPGPDPSRAGEGKRTNLQGDLEIIDNEGPLRENSDERGDRDIVLGDAAIRDTLGPNRPRQRHSSRADRLSSAQFYGPMSSDCLVERMGEGYDIPCCETYPCESLLNWPPAEHVQREDIINALGAYVPLEDVTDFVDRARIGTCLLERLHAADVEHQSNIRREGIEERWRRRAFYLDEEEGTLGRSSYHGNEDDYEATSDRECNEDSDWHNPTPRSRSSSKVRFQDDVTDNEYETRSNQSTSSRSIPVGERWGGYEIPEVERDAGKEILYQVTQQGLNELLDLIFKPKEDLLMEAHRTRAERKRWSKEIERFRECRHRSKDTDNYDAGVQAGEETENSMQIPKELLLERGITIDQEFLDGLDREDELHQADMSHPEGSITSGHSSEPEVEYFPLAPESEAFQGEDKYSLTLDDNTPETPDPTLPQNRPNDEDLVALTCTPHVDEVSSNADHPHSHSTEPRPIYESASTSTSTSAPSRRQSSNQPRSHNRSLPLRLRFQQSPPPNRARTNSGSSLASSSSSPPVKNAVLPSPPPSPKILARWARLNSAEQEAKERGGSGAKLNFEEFAMRMQGERGKRLGFVASWIDMTTF
ncbi:EF hand domain-containing protein [Arthroderma uncinatum]|uniref:EF hand domain-containing protein n=1 Tax=Arthroderma uncinatum TaxID=74035 RepID=UPI00144AC9CC|nr:EF hand domain-containing protein [Arthroderma uncinatum]KAF3480660.1 EF hand domain-containing protein [Arthroderma uncinatum]